MFHLTGMNAFWLPLFAMTVFQIATIVGKQGWEKIRKMRPDDFQRGLKKWKDNDPRRDEMEQKALQFAQKREQQIKDYLQRLAE
jgi:hypothetical protein